MKQMVKTFVRLCCGSGIHSLQQHEDLFAELNSVEESWTSASKWAFVDYLSNTFQEIY